MKKIGGQIPEVVDALGAKSPTARLNLRAHQVRARYQRALETVYGESTPLFLEHTNNVYIMDKEGVRTLIVYVDDSIFAAELNAQRELIKLKLLELFGEDVEEFQIYISRGSYKANHPYLASEDEAREQAEAVAAPSIPLDSSERRFVSETVSRVEDDALRGYIEKAMTASLEWKKGEKANSPTENR